ncbi:MAG: hypothetical protein ACRELB_20405, partial [Polyangiaceae bacterium]
MRPSIALLPLAFALAGCVEAANVPVFVDPDPAPVPVAVVERQLTVAAEQAPAPPSADSVVRVSPRDPVRFQIGAGYGALARVDVSACRDRGLPPGYVRVRATFTHEGYIVRASVESPTAPPPTALDCIADGLRQTGVPAFDGGEARLSKTYYVEPGETVP